MIDTSLCVVILGDPSADTYRGTWSVLAAAAFNMCPTRAVISGATALGLTQALTAATPCMRGFGLDTIS